jgi:hypothetical protein
VTLVSRTKTRSSGRSRTRSKGAASTFGTTSSSFCVGDSLCRKVAGGIARSRFDVVVLWHACFAKSWPQYELDALVTMAVSGKQRRRSVRGRSKAGSALLGVTRR